MTQTNIASLAERRRAALGQDVLLFCFAFTVGVVVFAAGYILTDVFSASDRGDYWSLGLSDSLMLSGFVAGELFMLWNNGVRQGRRGHSIGKHRIGLRVVDAKTGEPTGWLRGLVRGIVLVLLLDWSIAAIPVNLPTVSREFTPESWHFGGAAYLALALLVIPFLLRSRRGFADVVSRTSVVDAQGLDARLAAGRKQLLLVLDVVGVVGVLAVAANYLMFYGPFLPRFPSFF